MGTRSEVWLLASKLNNQEAQCNLCTKIIKYCGTSTNIRRHLEKCHCKAFSKIQKKTREDDESFVSGIDDSGVRTAAAGVKRMQTNAQRWNHQKRLRKFLTLKEPEAVPSTSSNMISLSDTENDVNMEKVIVVMRDDEPMESHINDSSSSKPTSFNSISLDPTSLNPTSSQSTLLNPTSLGPSTELDSACDTSLSWSNLMDYDEMELTSSHPEHLDSPQKISKRGGEMDSEVTRGLIYMIVKNCLPFSIVESDGFQYFMSIVCPHYQIPCATTIKNAIDRKYDALFEMEKKKLSSVKYFSLTVGIWTETHSLSSILRITAYHVGDRGQMKSVVLGYTEITQSHFADVITEYMQKILDKWGIRLNQITAVTSDNGANIVAALKSLFGEASHIGCFAHTLNLIPTAALKNEKVETIVESVKNIVTWLNNSCFDTDYQKKVEDLRLIQPCPTGWNSIYYMLRRFLEIKSTIAEIVLGQTNAPLMINGNDIAVIEDFLPILELFDSLTKECSKGKSVSVSRIIPIVDFLSNKLETLEPTTEIGKIFQTTLVKNFEKHFGDSESNYTWSISTLLDPRYKKIHFKSPLKCSKAVLQLRNLINKQNSDSNISENGSAVLDQPYQLTDLDKFTANKSQLAAGLRPCELTSYLQRPTADVTVDPLQYWFVNRHEYPQLYKIAKRLLCVQGSSTPCERLFPIASFIMNARRNRIPMEMLEKLLFLKNLARNQWEL